MYYTLYLSKSADIFAISAAITYFLCTSLFAYKMEMNEMLSSQYSASVAYVSFVRLSTFFYTASARQPNKPG
jgi:hypothetical protein